MRPQPDCAICTNRIPTKGKEYAITRIKDKAVYGVLATRKDAKQLRVHWACAQTPYKHGWMEVGTMDIRHDLYICCLTCCADCIAVYGCIDIDCASRHPGPFVVLSARMTLYVYASAHIFSTLLRKPHKKQPEEQSNKDMEHKYDKKEQELTKENNNDKVSY